MLTKTESYPRTHTHAVGNWEVTVNYTGVYSTFVFGIAQAGQAKGFITLKGDGKEVVVGNPTRPINLSVVDRVIERVVNEIRNTHNLEPDKVKLLPFLKDALKPYNYPMGRY